jgi:hypothetical protein
MTGTVWFPLACFLLPRLGRAGCTGGSCAASVLRPQSSESRELLELSGGGWLLAADRSGEALAPRSKWLATPLQLHADPLGRPTAQVHHRPPTRPTFAQRCYVHIYNTSSHYYAACWCHGAGLRGRVR